VNATYCTFLIAHSHRLIIVNENPGYQRHMSDMGDSNKTLTSWQLCTSN